MLKGLFLSGAMFAASTAQAAQWQMFMPAGQAPNRTAWFIDRSSVRLVGGDKRAWFQMINETPDTKRIKSMKALIELDCAGKRSRFIAIEMFGEKGLLGQKETPADWSYSAPDSPIETLSQTVCTNNYGETITANASPDIMAQAAFETLDNRGRVKHRR